MIRALVVGATGLLGHGLWREWSRRAGWEVVATARAASLPGLEAVDVEDRAAFGALVERVKPRVTVLLASNPHVDYCERHPEQTRKLNVDATVAAAASAAAAGSKFVFFSSDYVFDGKAGPYGEADPPNPINEYGRQKLESERGVARACPDSLILRISGLFGWELRRKNFVLQVVDALKAGRKLTAASDIRYNPTYAPNLAAVLAELVEKDCRGIYHAAGAEEFSRYDFAQEVARAFGLDDPLIEAVKQAELRSPTPRPLHTSLRTDKVRAASSSPLLGARKALRDMRRAEAEWERYAAGLQAPGPAKG